MSEDISSSLFHLAALFYQKWLAGLTYSIMYLKMKNRASVPEDVPMGNFSEGGLEFLMGNFSITPNPIVLFAKEFCQSAESYDLCLRRKLRLTLIYA